MKAKGGMFSRLAGLLIKGGPAGTVPPAKPQPKPAAKAEPEEAEDSFQVTIQQIMQEEQGRFDTKLHIISLVEFREAIGDKWGKVADKVMLIAEGVIQLHLGAGNVCGRQGQDFFILIFRTCDGFEARERALTIAKELGTRLVGDKVLGADRPLALAAEVSLAEAANADGSLNLWTVQQAIDEIRAIVASDNADTIEEPALRSWMKTRLDQEPEHGLRRHMMPSAPLPAQAPLPVRASMLPSKAPPLPPQPAPRPQPKPPPIAVSAMIDPSAMASPQWQEINVNAIPAMDGILDAGLPLPPDVRLSQLWRPTWVADGEVIGAYRAHIQRRDAVEAAPLEGAQAYTGGTETAHSLDRFSIGQAMRAFSAAERAGLASTIILPIHWTTLYSSQRMSLLAPLADITQEARAARLTVELFGFPTSVNADDLCAALRVLRPLCRNVAVRTRLSYPHAALAAQSGAALLTLDLSELADHERLDDDRLLHRLYEYLNQAQAAGLGACLWGARRRKVVAGAVLGGFAMVNGPALMKDLAKPAKVVPAPKARFKL